MLTVFPLQQPLQILDHACEHLSDHGRTDILSLTFNDMTTQTSHNLMLPAKGRMTHRVFFIVVRGQLFTVDISYNILCFINQNNSLHIIKSRILYSEINSL